jgi:hypothetical protein
LGFGRDDRLAHDLRRFARGPLGIVNRFDFAFDLNIDRGPRGNFQKLMLHELQNLHIAWFCSKNMARHTQTRRA